MRILACNWRDLAHPHAGGAEVYLESIAREWVVDGHEVTIFCAAVAGRPTEEIVEGVRYVRRGGRLGVYRQAKRYWKHEGAGSYDLVVDSVNTRPFLCPRFVNDVPVVAIIHQVAREVWSYEAPWPAALLGRYVLEPWWLRTYRDVRVVTVSESSRASLVEHGLRQVTTVPEGWTPHPPLVGVEKESDPTVVFVGRLSANKRPDHALEAFALIRRELPTATMWVIGSGPMETKLRDLVEEKSGVSFLGHVPEGEKRRRLARADVLVVTSVREGWGLVVTEAAAVGTPTIAYDVAGLRDSVPASGGVLTEANPASLAAEVVRRIGPASLQQELRPRVAGVQEWAEVARSILGRDEEPESSCGSGRRSSWRRALALVGVVAVLLLGGLGHGLAGNVLSGVALMALVGATVLAWTEARSPSRSRGRPDRLDSGGRPSARERRRSWGAASAVFLATFVAAQSWFEPGKLIAGGDLSPVVGTAWLGKIFTPWVGTGSNLGGPAANETSLPWAGVYALVHVAGGSPAIAQRVWLTLLFCGAGLAGYALMRLLGLRPVWAALGALAYVFNAHVVSDVGTNPVFLAAMVVLPLLPAIEIMVASGRWRWMTGAMVFGLTAPLVGYVYENPPLVLMIAALAVAVPPLMWWLHGRVVARKAVIGLLSGVALLVALSAYWIVPAVVELKTVATTTLSSPSSWLWTESRASLANGFWLNNTWGWSYRAYYPYAPAYQHFPLDLLKFLLPVGAFAALMLRPGDGARDRHTLRLTAAMASGALLVVFLSTGTDLPGSVVFDGLYRLPFGWVLQDPGRFLIVAGLMYGVLLGTSGQRTAAWLGSRARVVPRLALARGPRRAGIGAATLGSALVLATLAPGFPLASGAIVPNDRPQLPSSHVKVPGYWFAMASVINERRERGNLLVLPRDDFYQMPYRWGYYGADGFIIGMIRRQVIDPVGQGYTPASNELESAAGLFQQAVLSGRWALSRDLSDAMGVPYVLVRGDIETGLKGRHIEWPRKLALALIHDPAFSLVARRGPLELFGLRQAASPAPVTTFVTVNSHSPNLRELSLFRPGTALVTSRMRPGTRGVIQPPPVAKWSVKARTVTWSVRLKRGWRYRVETLNANSRSPRLVRARQQLETALSARRIHGKGSSIEELSFRLGSSLLSNGSFSKGLWAPVGNCDAAPGTRATAKTDARVVDGAGPNGAPMLLLSAAQDSACEARSLSWRSGSLLIAAWMRNLRGTTPTLCLWESALGRCAALPPIPGSTHGWYRYQAEVSPPRDAGRLTLFLYANAATSGQPTANGYASVVVREAPRIAQSVLIAIPITFQRAQLRVGTESFSSDWNNPGGGQHVLVDGLMNGWIGGRELSVRPRYELVAAYTTSRTVSLVAAVMVMASLVWSGLALLLLNLHRRRREESVRSR